MGWAEYLSDSFPRSLAPFGGRLQHIRISLTYTDVRFHVADWYYIGHYGQLGPLTLEQMDELVQGGVIGHDTYVWRSGMTDWLHAATVNELSSSFSAGAAFNSPPPPPMPSASSQAQTATRVGSPYQSPAFTASGAYPY